MVANFEGAVNATTLTCNVTHLGFQIGTFWSLGNFDGVSGTRGLLSADPDSDVFLIGGDTYENRVTVLNWTSAVDGVTIFCGTGQDREQAGVILKIYSELIILLECTMAV